jgi:hypothetical protein
VAPVVPIRCRPSSRQFTSQDITHNELLEASTDSCLSSSLSSLKEDGESEDGVPSSTTSSAAHFGDESIEDDTKPLPVMNNESSATPSQERVNVRIPGRESQVIMVSDDMMKMLQQNAEIVKASIPKLEEPDEPMIRAVPIIMYKGEEAYFQFDYRNHPPVTDNDTKNLIRKIERVLRNIHLEPIGDKDRGVETMRMNVENMADGEDYRLSRRSYHKNGLFEPINAVPPKITRKALLKTLTERHSLYVTKNNPRFGGLDRNKLGQSLFGEDSEVEVKARDVAAILHDLWCFGYSSFFNGLQRRHFAMKRRKEVKAMKKLLQEEMKDLSYPEPLAKHMEKEGKVGLAHSNGVKVICVKDNKETVSPYRTFHHDHHVTAQ